MRRALILLAIVLASTWMMPVAARAEEIAPRAATPDAGPVPAGPNPAQAARLAVREGRHRGSTRGLAMGYVRCNLVIVPQTHAYGMLLYRQRNQRACPLIEVLDAGSWEPKQSAPGADLRTDLPLDAVCAAEASGIEFMITHAPAHGFITDIEADRLEPPSSERFRRGVLLFPEKSRDPVLDRLAECHGGTAYQRG